jgi:hypothetical protein
MLLVSEVVEFAKVGALSNLAIAKNENVIMKFIYLGISELYKRFNLSIKIESVVMNPNLSVYELRNPDVDLLLSLYDINGKQLNQNDVLSGNQHDYKIINYRSFLVLNPSTDIIFAVYRASPPKILSMEDELILPNAFVEALLAYIAHMGHSTINKDNVNESGFYYKKFNNACLDLEMQGYKISINTETINMLNKGYV